MPPPYFLTCRISKLAELLCYDHSKIVQFTQMQTSFFLVMASVKLPWMQKSLSSALESRVPATMLASKQGAVWRAQPSERNKRHVVKEFVHILFSTYSAMKLHVICQQFAY